MMQTAASQAAQQWMWMGHPPYSIQEVCALLMSALADSARVNSRLHYTGFCMLSRVHARCLVLQE